MLAVGAGGGKEGRLQGVDPSGVHMQKDALLFTWHERWYQVMWRKCTAHSIAFLFSWF